MIVESAEFATVAVVVEATVAAGLGGDAEELRKSADRNAFMVNTVFAHGAVCILTTSVFGITMRKWFGSAFNWEFGRTLFARRNGSVDTCTIEIVIIIQGARVVIVTCGFWDTLVEIRITEICGRAVVVRTTVNTSVFSTENTREIAYGMACSSFVSSDAFVTRVALEVVAAFGTVITTVVEENVVAET